MEQILTEELVKRTIEDTLHTLDRIGQGYRKCFITQTDCFYTMLSEFSDGFWAFLRNNGLQIRIKSGNYEALKSISHSLKRRIFLGKITSLGFLNFQTERKHRKKIKNSSCI